MILPTAEQMRKLDETAIERFGIPGLVLMENAGRLTFEAMTRHFGPVAGRDISILVGPGNNGGDGLVIARHIQQAGGRARALLLVPPEKIRGDAAVNLRIAQNLGIRLQPVLTADDLRALHDFPAASEMIVDAIFGTGLTREVSGLFREIIEKINSCRGPKIAVDIPSGLDSDRGHPLGTCVQADLTVTFGFPKPGLVVSPGRLLAGRLEVADIGIPREAAAAVRVSRELLERESMAEWLTCRSPDSHKGTYGHLLVLAGSTGKTGAAILCALGGLRAGAGLVTLGVPEGLNQVFETRLAEAMTVPLPQADDGGLALAGLESILAALPGKQAAVLGPGVGASEETRGLVSRLLERIACPLVLDADGLNVLAGNLGPLAKSPGPRILTPHPGEMARLCGETSKTVQNGRLPIAEAFAREHRVILVLKGARTVIAAPDGRTAINPTGNPGMATGGMGDVLSGIIGSLLAQGLAPWQAACLGAYVHGRAGDLLAAKQSAGFGFLASELADQVPAAMAQLQESGARIQNERKGVFT